MLVRVAFAHVSSLALHSGEPAYDGEPIVVELAQVLEVDRSRHLAVVRDNEGIKGFVHISRLYNAHRKPNDGEVELASWEEL